MAEKEAWTTIASGLFTTLRTTSSASISGLTLSGKTGIVYYNGTSTDVQSTEPRNGDNKLFDKKLQTVGVGMLAGSIANAADSPSISISNVKLSNATVNRNTPDSVAVGNVSTFAGGLIGVAGNANNAIAQITITDCSSNALAVTGLTNAGGLLGYLNATQSEITGYTGTSGFVKTTMVKCFTLREEGHDGAGGLIGYCDGGKLDIDNVTMNALNVSANTSSSYKNNVGGLVGTWRVANGQSCSVTGIQLEGIINLIGSTSTGSNINSNVGGIAGYVVDTSMDSDIEVGSNKFNMTVDGVEIGTAAGSSVELKNGAQIGGLFGLYKSGFDGTNGKLELKNISIGSADSTTSLLTGEKVTGTPAVSGLVGVLCLYPEVTVENAVLENTAILSGKHASTFFAHTANQNEASQLNVDVRNTKVDGCTVAVWAADGAAGFVYGQMDHNKTSFTGINLLIQNSTIGYLLTAGNALSGAVSEKPEPLIVGVVNSSGANAENIGIFGGAHSGTGKSLRLVGVSLLRSSTPSKDFGIDPRNGSYVIRSYYAGAANSVAQDVTIKPEGVFPGINGGILTSDGIAFASGTTPLAQKIVEDASGDSVPKNRTYFNVPDAMEFFHSNPGYFSTYKNGGENALPTGGMDFPVLIINASEPDPTGVVMNYISILTNQVETPASHIFHSIKATTYVVPTNEAEGTTGSAFLKDDSNKSLEASTSGVISIVPDGYDNQRNQFTLLDVQYADPTDSSKITYHLYIPVIVKKILEFRFWAAALMGTAYTVNAYGQESVSQLAIGSNGEQVTLLLSFEYQRKPKEWQAVIDKGEYLLWNFNKCIILDNVSQQGEATGTLPTGTKLTLVDRSNKAKAYFGVSNELLDGNTLYFSRFGGWEQPFLCDGLDLTYAPDDTGKFIEVAKDADPTLRAADAQGEFHYFRLAAGEGEEVQRYSITVGKELKEQYYLTIQTPAATEVERNSIVNMVVKCPSKLPNPENGGLPTKLVKNEGVGGSDFARYGNENRFVLGNFFTQNITVTSEFAELINNDANTIKATLEATIQFVDGQKNNYMIWANGQDLHQQFKLFLQFTDPTNSTDTPRNFADGTKLTVTFQNGETVTGSLSEYLSSSDSAIRLKFPGSIPVDQMGADGLTLTAEVELEFSPSAIVNQFEPGTSDLNHPGITVWGETCLAYSEAALDYSSQRKEAGDTRKRYYRDNTEPATLRYNAHENLNGSVVTGVSRLGVNGLEDEVFSIPTAGIYDVSALSDAAKATQLRCSLRLEQKGQDGNYLPVNIGDYLSVSGISAVVTNAGVERTLKAVSESNFTYTFNLGDGFSKEVPIHIPVNLEVITGAAFEEKGFQYANYKVVLTAELYDGNGLISKSSANDYIIYTNAKIKFDLIS